MDEAKARMRVLVTTPDLDATGGVSNYFKVLQPYLDGVADYYSIGLRHSESSAVKTLLRLISVYAGFTLKLLRKRYDLVHINSAFAPRALPRDAIFLLLAKALRRPVTVFMRGGDPERVPPAWIRLLRLAYSRADSFIVLAREHGRKLREFGYAGKIECETTVAPPEAFSAPSPHRQDGAQRFRIIFLARLEREKGLYEAIEAYSIVKRRHSHAEFVIAGDGAEYGKARRYVQDRAIPDVCFLGHVTGDKKAKAFVNSHLYLFTSYYEGMPNSVLEAMAYGLPVVTTRVGGIVDFFEDGRMGFLADSADAEVLATLIERVIAAPELARRMGTTNRAYAERHFAAPVVARRLIAIYSAVVAQAPRGAMRP